MCNYDPEHPNKNSIYHGFVSASVLAFVLWTAVTSENLLGALAQTTKRSNRPSEGICATPAVSGRGSRATRSGLQFLVDDDEKNSKDIVLYIMEMPRQTVDAVHTRTLEDYVAKVASDAKLLQKPDVHRKGDRLARIPIYISEFDASH